MKTERCGYHVWPEDGEYRGERCILDEGHEEDHGFHDAAEVAHFLGHPEDESEVSRNG